MRSLLPQSLITGQRAAGDHESESHISPLTPPLWALCLPPPLKMLQTFDFFCKSPRNQGGSCRRPGGSRAVNQGPRGTSLTPHQPRALAARLRLVRWSPELHRPAAPRPPRTAQRQQEAEGTRRPPESPAHPPSVPVSGLTEHMLPVAH